MKNPPHPGRLVAKAGLEPIGLSVTVGARVMGVARPTLIRLINGRAGLSPEMAIRLEKALGGTAAAWFRMQTAYDLAQARRRQDQIKVERYATA